MKGKLMHTMTKTELKAAIKIMQKAADEGRARPSTIETLAKYKNALENDRFIKTGGNGALYLFN